jgi:hypothetical protein
MSHFGAPSTVVHETIDGETIAIDLATGTYYSLAGSAAGIWAAVTAGLSRGDAVAATVAHYGGGANAEELDAFLDPLHDVEEDAGWPQVKAV